MLRSHNYEKDVFNAAVIRDVILAHNASQTVWWTADGACSTAPDPSWISGSGPQVRIDREKERHGKEGLGEEGKEGREEAQTGSLTHSNFIKSAPITNNMTTQHSG